MSSPEEPRRPSLLLRELRVRRAPGFPDGGPQLAGLVAGVNLVLGPNASGKTTAARALERLLWPEAGAKLDPRLRLEADLQLDAAPYRLEVEAGTFSCRRGGEESPWPEPAPATARDRYFLGLEDLVKDSGTELAAAIAQELAGGYDLAAAREAAGFRAGPSQPRKLSSELEAAEAEVRERQRGQEALREKEDHLQALEAEQATARAAGKKAELLTRAVDHARAEAEGREAKARLALLPAGAGRLQGDELESLERLEADFADLKRRQQKAQAERARQELAAAAAELPAAGLPGELLATLAAREEELRAVEADLHRVEQERETARAAASQALAALHREGEVAADLDRARQQGTAGLLPHLDGLLRQAGRLESAQALFDRTRAALGEAAEAPDPDPLAQGARQLRQWLAAAGPFPPWWTALGLLLVAAAPLALAAFLAREEPRWWIAAGLAAALALTLAGTFAAAGLRRSHLRSDFAAGGLPPPGRWRRREVGQALAQLEEQEAEARDRQLRQEIWQRVGVDEEALQRQRRALDEERLAAAEALGLGPDVSALGLALLAERLQSLARATDSLGEREAAAKVLGERRQALLDRLGDSLPTYGYGAPRERAEAYGAVQDLSRRDAAWKEAERQRKDQARRLAEEIEPGLVRVEGERRALLERLGLAPGLDSGEVESLLREWLPHLAGYQAARKALQDAEARREGARQALEAMAGEEAAELLAADLPSLEEELERARGQAGRLAELSLTIGDIRGQVRAARESHDLEAALARREKARADLAAERESDYTAVAGWILAEHLRRERHSGALPAVLARAQETFAAITRQRYELRAQAGDGASLQAYDRQLMQVQTLEQLSTGTRLQLLIAARIAFIEEQERAARLPLVLDEALAAADPGRAEALIGAIAELARRGRQVICFTAQPEEVSRWEQVLGKTGVEHSCLDLGAAVRRSQLLARPLPALPPPRQPVPQPAGRDRQAYGEALQVPGIDPWAPGLGGVHLWHLVPEPADLYPLLAAGFTSWGQAEGLLQAGGADRLVPGSEETLRAAAARARALGTALDEWRLGRGRPVDAEVLAASGAITDTFLAEVSALADRLHGDGEALLQALEGGEVKRFQSAKREELETYLRREGFLDPEPPRSRDEVRLRTLSAAAADLDAGLLSSADVDRLLDQLFTAP